MLDVEGWGNLPGYLQIQIWLQNTAKTIQPLILNSGI